MPGVARANAKLVTTFHEAEKGPLDAWDPCATLRRIMTTLRRFRACLLACACLVSAVAGDVREARADEAAPAPTPQGAQRRMKAGFEGGQAAVATLKASRAAPPPAKMTDPEKVEYAAYQVWLGGLIERIEERLAPMQALQANVEKARTITASDATKMKALTADFLAMMRTIEAEAAQKNVPVRMKSKHDTVKNSISNVR